MYWSSTSYALDPRVAWLVGFNNGHVDGKGKDFLHYVRAVRSGP